ncbi:MAG: amidohydrolase [Dehalococcoidia bacterium]|nr:amidohydrolase [Dehalococcoidia bacterium]
MSMVIDVHDHFTTVPGPLQQYRGGQVGSVNQPRPFQSSSITDEMLINAVKERQIKHMADKGIDRLIFSPTAGAMGHQFGNFKTSLYWSQACNDMVNRVCKLFPDKFLPSCQLPQSPGTDPKAWLPELEMRVKEQGFVACNINPDIAGGASFTPSVADDWWYPLYAKLEELDVPGHFHVSATLNPAFHINGSHYISWHHTSAFELMWNAQRIWKDFPKLKLIVSHGGGGVALQYNRTRSLTVAAKIDFEENVRKFYWDLAVYEQESMETLIKMVGADNCMFATEMWGTANAIDPKSGKFFDDTVSFVKDNAKLTADEKHKVFEATARKVYSKAKFDV